MKRHSLRTLFVFSLGLGAILTSARAELRLASVFTDNAVLQRGKPIAVWGWGDAGQKVVAKLDGQAADAEVKDGKWKLFLPQMSAGGPHTLTVTAGDKTVTLSNILIGEVWVCSGQSNMEWPMSMTFEPHAAIDSSANDKIRLYTVPKRKAEKPVDDIPATWVPCQPDNVKNFSATAYYFGRKLQKDLGVPVGLIHTSWGGSPAEVWIREEVMAANDLYKKNILEPYPAVGERNRQDIEKWEQEKAALEKEGKKITRGRPWSAWRPAELYNGMIYPLLPYSIAGAIWYQGESNAGRAHEYRSLFADMISNWREDFGQGDFPFLAVQLAPWDKGRKRELAQITEKPGESDWAELREAQNWAAKVLPNVGIAVITDAGDKDDIHPGKKQPAGERMALAARGIAYGEKGTWFGPTYRSCVIREGKVILSFDHVGEGLASQGGALTGFAIAGRDRNFVWADARIDGDKVVVSSPSVPEPLAVRYGWSDFPVVNLWNKNGLPASPFRTDNFPMTTGPRR